jgi:tetratricopeptide (TPR) repeat protein
MRAHALIALLLVAGVCAVYAPLREQEFVDYDDAAYVEKLRPGWSQEGLRRAVAEPVVSNWIPATMLSLLIGQEIHGTGAAGHKLVNALLHAAAAVLLYAALALASGARLPSAFVAGVFAVHPLHVESVAWMSQRKDVLCGFFWMASLAAYAAYARHGGALRYAAVLLGTTLALLSKPMAVTLPFTLLLLDYWPLRRLPTAGALATAIVEKLPLFALAAIASAITYQVQSASGAVATTDLLPFGLRAANAVRAVFDYVADAIWPAGLAVFYPHPRELPAMLVPALAVLAALTAGALHQAKARPYLVVGWLWFLGTLVPVLGLVQVGEQARADRYTYVPLIGLAIAVAFAAAELGERRPRLRRAGVAAGSCALLALALVARAQVEHWRDSRALFTRALAVTQDNAFAQRGLGRALRRAGRLDEAEAHLAAALRLEPQPAVRRELAEIRAGRGDVPGAIAHYRGVLQSDPGDLRSRVNLGQLLVRARRYPEARAELSDALSRADHGARLPIAYRRTLHLNLARAQAALGETGAAQQHARAALELDPTGIAPRLLLAELALRAGDRRTAEAQLESAAGQAERRGDAERADALRSRLRSLRANDREDQAAGAGTSSSTDSSPGTPTRSGKP